MSALDTREIEKVGDLSAEERDALLKVMQRAKDFDKRNAQSTSTGYVSLEGQLYKWTNPLKGWQPRWFYVDHEQGVLHYYTSEERRKMPPRASLHLWGAVVSPSDEDSQSFIIQGANTDCYRLKAADARDRQTWVSRLRQEVEHANTLAIGPRETLQASGKSAASLTTSPTNHHDNHRSSAHSQVPSSSVENSPIRTTSLTTPSKKHNRKSKSQLSAPISLSITKLKRSKSQHKTKEVSDSSSYHNDDVTMFPGGDAMLESLTQLQSLQETLNQSLESSIVATGLQPHDQNVLLLKMTSQAAVQGVQDTLAMMNLQLGLRLKEMSPSRTLSPHSHSSSAVTTAHRDGRGTKVRPFSMVDSPSDSTHTREEEVMHDDTLMRSLSVSEVLVKPSTSVTGSGKHCNEAP